MMNNVHWHEQLIHQFRTHLHKSCIQTMLAYQLVKLTEVISTLYTVVHHMVTEYQVYSLQTLYTKPL